MRSESPASGYGSGPRSLDGTVQQSTPVSSVGSSSQISSMGSSLDVKRRSGGDIGFGSIRKSSAEGVIRFRRTSSSDGLGYDGIGRRSSSDVLSNETELEEYPIAIAVMTRTPNAYDATSLSFQVCVLVHCLSVVCLLLSKSAATQELGNFMKVTVELKGFNAKPDIPILSSFQDKPHKLWHLCRFVLKPKL